MSELADNNKRKSATADDSATAKKKKPDVDEKDEPDVDEKDESDVDEKDNVADIECLDREQVMTALLHLPKYKNYSYACMIDEQHDHEPDKVHITILCKTMDQMALEIRSKINDYGWEEYAVDEKDEPDGDIKYDSDHILIQFWVNHGSHHDHIRWMIYERQLKYDLQERKQCAQDWTKALSKVGLISIPNTCKLKIGKSNDFGKSN
jgi:hypothetical protein